jgi:hypothetical protein
MQAKKARGEGSGKQERKERVQLPVILSGGRRPQSSRAERDSLPEAARRIAPEGASNDPVELLVMREADHQPAALFSSTQVRGNGSGSFAFGLRPSLRMTTL